MKYILVVVTICLSFLSQAQSGCTDSGACNFDSLALVEDDTCIYIGDSCIPEGVVNNAWAFFTTPECNCEEYHPGDFNNDNIITVTDLSEVLALMGGISNYFGDFDASGSVTAADLTSFLSMFGAGVP